MTNRKTLLAFTALATLSGGIAHAIELPSGTVDRQAIETAFTGYEYIDIRFGPTQVKVEAVDTESGQKIEAVYLKATGALLKTETEAAGDDAGRTGVFVRSLTEDFEDDDTDGDDDTSDTTGEDDDTSDLSDADDDDTSDTTGGDDNSSESSGGDDDSGDSSGGDDDSGGDDSED